MIGVIAGNYQQFLDATNGDKRNFKYIAEIEDTYGYRFDAVLMVGTYPERKGWQELQARALQCGKTNQTHERGSR